MEEEDPRGTATATTKWWSDDEDVEGDKVAKEREKVDIRFLSTNYREEEEEPLEPLPEPSTRREEVDDRIQGSVLSTQDQYTDDEDDYENHGGRLRRLNRQDG